MHKEIVINSTPNEVRIALLEDQEVVEFSMERSDNKRVVGNVYKGVVTAVRPGLQAAFVDIGMEKAGFLHVSDLIHDNPDEEDDGGRGRGRRPRRRSREGLRPIENMLKEGEEILVQVTKEVIGTKGPRLTADVSLPGRFMVLMPKGDHVGVSRKIDDRKERHRLRDMLSGLKHAEEGGAYIIRTAAIGVEKKMLERDMDYLRNLHEGIQRVSQSQKAPALVHEDVGLMVGMLRDIFKDDIDSVVVDSKEDHQRLLDYAKTFSPELRDRIRFYSGDVPIFDKYGVEQELRKSLDRKVWMKRGGFLVIEQTEALVAIDVNTGRYTGKRNQAETIFKTNMLAAKEAARQLRLRDVGGIIVIDFIDMDSEEDKRRVLAELRQHLKRDRSRTKSFAVSDLGLIEMSRQRVQESLKDRLSDECPYCAGTGQVLSVDTLANKVERLIQKLAVTGHEKAVQIRANPTLALMLMTDRAAAIRSIARSTGMQVDVTDDSRLHREEFQIMSLSRRKDLVSEIEKASPEVAARRPSRSPRSDDRRTERSDRGERSDRRPRSDRSDRGERSDRRPERSERRPDRGDRPEASDRGNRGERRSRRPDREPTADLASRDPGNDRASRGASEDQADALDGRRPRRRRRRRRRPGGDEAGDSAATRSERAGTSADGTSTDVREEQGRSPRRDPSREEPRRDAPTPERSEVQSEQPRAAQAQDGAPGEEDSGRRRRRRGRRGGRGRRRAGAREEVDAADQAVSKQESTVEASSMAVSRPAATEEPRSQRASRDTADPQPREWRSSRSQEGRREEGSDSRRPRRERRPAREDRPADSIAPAGPPTPSSSGAESASPVASTEEYVRPVPAREPTAEAPVRDPKPVEVVSSDAGNGARPDGDSRSAPVAREESHPPEQRERRKRRTRRTGRQTRDIGRRPGGKDD